MWVNPSPAVIAESPYIAEDAAQLVFVDYSNLPVSADYLSALDDGAATAHSDFCG